MGNHSLYEILRWSHRINKGELNRKTDGCHDDGCHGNHLDFQNNLYFQLQHMCVRDYKNHNNKLAIVRLMVLDKRKKYTQDRSLPSPTLFLTLPLPSLSAIWTLNTGLLGLIGPPWFFWPYNWGSSVQRLTCSVCGSITGSLWRWLVEERSRDDFQAI